MNSSARASTFGRRCERQLARLGCGGEALVLPDEHLDLHRAAFDLLLVEHDGSEGLHAPRYAARALQAGLETLLGDARPDWDAAL